MVRSRDDSEWVKNFPLAYRSLLGDTHQKCQQMFEKKLEIFDNAHQFIEEFVQAAIKTVSERSGKLKQLPKTPAQKKQKRKFEVLTEQNEDDLGSLTKIKPTKLKFDLSSKDKENEEPSQAVIKKENSPKPTRATRQSRRAVNKAQADADSPKARPTRQSRRAVNKTASNTSVLSSQSNTKSDINADDDQLKVRTTPVENVKSCSSSRITRAAEDERSPSVYERANAYENMLVNRVSGSPLKKSRANTPESFNKKTSQVSKNSTKTESTAVSSSKENPKLAAVSESQERKSNSQNEQNLKDEKNTSVKSTRTRLRLNKTKKEEEPQQEAMDISEKAAPVIENVNNKNSAKISETGTMSNSDIASCDEIEYLSPVNDTMNETEVIVTEVFEVDPKDKGLRLKEFEKIQTKTTPVKATKTILTPSSKQKRISSDQGYDGECEDEEEDVGQSGSRKSSRSSRSHSRANQKDGKADKDNARSSLSDSRANLKNGKADKDNARSSRSRTKSNSSPADNARASRSRSRANIKDVQSLTVSNSSVTENNVNSTFTKDCPEPEEKPARSTRTRARAAQKKSLDNAKTADEEENSRENITAQAADEVVTGQKSTRTRVRKKSQDNLKTTTEESSGGNVTAESSDETTACQKSTRTRTRVQKKQEETKEVSEEAPSTRTRTRKKPDDPTQPALNRPYIDGTKTIHSISTQGKKPAYLMDDEIVASSPVDMSKAHPCGGKKRLLEERERGASPKPKRSRSCIGDPNKLHKGPLSASSPIQDADASDNEERDTVANFSPKRNPKTFQFNSVSSKGSFLNTTPNFSNTSRVYSFLSKTQNQSRTSFNTTPNRSNVLTSFLQRNKTPVTQTNQALQDQKKRKMLEKENKDRERQKKAADLRKRKIEEQKRQREEKERKVAENREQRVRQEQEQKDRINKKFEDKASLKTKLMEEREKEEKEKQKMRLKKQMEADARRKFEEEERLRKRLLQEEEAKEQERLMLLKKEHDEMERKKQIEEEKRKQEERKAELEQKRQEEVARIKKQEDERERERERLKQEKERQLAIERAERERYEREKREEKERKLKEELDKLKALEKERFERQQAEALKAQQNQKENAELQKMLNKHNSAVTKGASSNLNATQTMPSSSSAGQSYDLTPVKKKVYKASPNPDDYGIDDKCSDDSTDEDDAPKKKIPEWATGNQLKLACIRQDTCPPDLEAIFRTQYIEAPDLQMIFPNVRKKRFKQRTSSAVWNSPMLKMK